MTKKYDGATILALPMEENDSGATTVRGYLVALVRKVWEEDEGFSGKRPFGNSGWSSDLEKPLIVGGVVDGNLDGDGYVDHVNDEQVRAAINAAIDQMGAA